MSGSATLDAALRAELATAEAVCDLAWGYARRAKASPAYWIGGADDGCEYCGDCIDPAVDAAKARARPAGSPEPGEDDDEDDAIFCDGGWDDRRTSDTMCSCEACGKILGYALTDEGLAMEVRELEDREEPVLPTPPDQAYAAFAMIDAAVQALVQRGKPEEVAIAVKAIDIACREIGFTREMALAIAD